MKKILTIIYLLTATSLFAQDSTKTPINGYISYGLSLSNGNDFLTNTYTGLEGGIMYKNFGAGLVFGRGSLKGLGGKQDNLSNYFYEVKTFASYPIGAISGSVLFGYGGYLNSNHNFIEYGVGISYAVGKFQYGATYSNWDGVNYVTPNITYNF